MPVGEKGELGQEMKCLRSLLVSTITASMLVAGPGFADDIKSANIMLLGSGAHLAAALAPRRVGRAESAADVAPRAVAWLAPRDYG